MTAAAAFVEELQRSRVLAIVRSDVYLDEIVEALYRGGVSLVEVTLTSPGALDAIARLSQVRPVGAGTVRTIGDAEAAVAAGASFLVSPGLNTDLVTWAVQADIPHLPGVLTPTEIDAALSAGALAVKLFPISAVGTNYLDELRGPHPDLATIPTGGVGIHNAREYLDHGAIAVGVGRSLTSAGDATAITDTTRRLLAGL
jgi:2-dehydro-3-deoxyphosphogluconate aldolase/(4S)-4-hydroxy-2-oxoglutarate aldolase